MDAINYSYTRQHFAEVMDKVNGDHAPILVTRQKGKPVVIISLDEYNSLEETAYLLRSPNNAKRLLSALEQVRKGGSQERSLIEAEDAD
ncbi:MULTISPECIES: type II toxin-antitoxin system Phd/YefM family antitoxin [Methylomonas]|uniref:Antitoxin n=3 Tax=Methylomonas TaxID=416 RepID=A0A126T354_9GAMM|nr:MULTISPECIES: type II toxin-antitoxin system prevent-host-death family antitoxin [Methylomonas]AMK76154.1 prevent-host-death protein [Methylomonas denitrificans]OAH96062.1 prevent-host-death protein [Methylomonas methanica]TCV81347.1 antitoxin YefM [Methylomonas methanica]